MRIIAMLYVVFNHTNTIGFVHFVWHKPTSVFFWYHLFFAIFCKFGASLFFMISGALLLNKSQLSIRTILKNKVVKYFFILLFFSAFYALSNYILTNQAYTIETFIKQIYSSNIKYHLWYLYAYIAFLLLLPLLQSWCQHMEDKHFIYIIILHVIFRLITVGEYILFKGKLTINSRIIPILPVDIITIPIIGYYLENRINIKHFTVKKIGLMWFANIFCIVICCIATYIKGMEQGKFTEDNSQTFFSTLAFVNCMTIYLTIKKIFSRIQLNRNCERIIKNIGSCCFGIYLFHPMFKDMPYVRPLIDSLRDLRIPNVLVMLIYVLLMFVPALLLTFCIKKITKKWKYNNII